MSLDKVKEILNREALPEFTSILIGTEDGLPVVSTMNENFGQDNAGLLTVILNSIELLKKISDLGEMNYIVSVHENGGIFMAKIDSRHYMLITFNRKLKIGILIFHVRRIIREIRKYL